MVYILKSRKIKEISRYFRKIPKEEIEKVKYFVSDMSITFKMLRKIYISQKYI